MSVRVKLISRDDSLKVDESPINVPLSLKRYGLSEVVNQLLQTTEPIPFDFLVDGGKLLRTSLETYLTQNGLSSESIVNLEYVRAILPPTFMASFEHDDWVASVHTNSRNQAVTGSYDGVVRVWDKTGTVEHQFEGHQGAVLSAKWIGDSKVVSGSRDRNLHIWNTEGKELSGILRGHTGPVTSLAVLNNHKIVSGSQDTTLRVWTSRIKDLPAMMEPESSNQQASMKRRRMAENATRQGRTKTSFATLRGHSAPVTSVVAHPVEPDVVYSVSEDHTLRTWDLVTSKCIDTKTTGFSLLSVVALGAPTGLIACGSSARHIALVDPRSGTHSSVKQLQGHKNFVVSLAQSPSNPYQFASASHDGTIKLWDCRADRAMYTIERETCAREERDLYCVDWTDVLLAGGRNKKLEMFSTPS